MKLIDFGIGPIRNEIVHIQGGLLVLPHCLPPNTIAFLAEFVPNSFKNQSNDEISIEKLHSTLFRNKRFLVNLILQRNASKLALFMEKENPCNLFRFSFRATYKQRKNLHGFSFSINIANFEAFLQRIKLTKNLLFLKSDMYVSTYLTNC